MSPGVAAIAGDDCVAASPRGIVLDNIRIEKMNKNMFFWLARTALGCGSTCRSRSPPKLSSESVLCLNPGLRQRLCRRGSFKEFSHRGQLFLSFFLPPGPS